jgi:3-hydroxybutyryl-CoA dehydrogenase
MQVVVLASELQKAEWAGKEKEDFVWIGHEQEFLEHASSDVFIDLLYINTTERNALLAQLLPKPVLINSVTDTLSETNPSFIRLNGWPGFLSSPVVEVSCDQENHKAVVEAIFSDLGKTPEWLADEPGFVTARVVSMIINEAYLALAEGVSTKVEIDTAMKLGTAYPYGPFEWAEKIGLKNIAGLLQRLSQLHPRYTPAELLVQEADRST